MTQHPRPHDVIVIGAGLAGLAAGATAVRAGGPGTRVLVLEGHQPGGRARTTVTPDGFHLNQGAHALYRGAGREVLSRLGVRPTGGPPATDAYGVIGDRLQPLPGTVWKLLRSPWLGVRAKAQLARSLGTLPLLRPAHHAHQSAAAWIGGMELQPDADAVFRAVTRVATYCGHLDVLSAEVAVSQVQIALGKGVDYLDGGWQTLVDGLARTATRRGAELRTEVGVASVTDTAGGWRVTTTSGDVLDAATVIVASGGPKAAARLVPTLAGLGIVEHLGLDCEVACLDLGVNRAPQIPVAFGLDAPTYFSTHAPPAALAPPGQHVLHLLRYRVRSSAEDRAELRALAALVGIDETAVVAERFLHRMVAYHAIPTAGRGLAGRPGVAVRERPGLFLAGDWVGHTGLLADAALVSAEEAGRAAAVHCASSRVPHAAQVA